MYLMEAVPLSRTLASAASYEWTVKPYQVSIAQHFDLILRMLQSKNPLDTIYVTFVTVNPMVMTKTIAYLLMPIFFVAAQWNRNWSQVDRCWSMLPVLFNAYYAAWNHLEDQHPVNAFTRVDLAFAVSLVWGTRLTYNFWRRGGYKVGNEDYRWDILKARIGSVGFFLLDVFFISTVQILLLWSITLPTYVLVASERAPAPRLLPVDYAFGGAILTLIAIIGTADQQQWNYQNAKYAYKASAKAQPGYTNAELDRGFNTRGLWAYSRHPNFTCEQGVWVTLYLWSCAVTGTWYNWSGIGALGYLALFQGSASFSEEVSSSKYPEYSEYKRQVSMFIPIPGYSWDAKAAEKRAGKKSM